MVDFFSVCFQLIVATEHWKALSDQENGLLLQDGQSSKLPIVNKKKDEKKKLKAHACHFDCGICKDWLQRMN